MPARGGMANEVRTDEARTAQHEDVEFVRRACRRGVAEGNASAERSKGSAGKRRREQEVASGLQNVSAMESVGSLQRLRRGESGYTKDLQTAHDFHSAK